MVVVGCGLAIQLTAMITLSAGIASATVIDLLQTVDQQLALLQVARLAPTTTASQTHSAISTMVFISFAERFAHAGRLHEEKDPMPARIDSFGSGKIEKEEGVPENQGSRGIEKMKSMATERSKNSFRSGKFTLEPNSKQSPSSAREPSVKGKQSPSSFMISLYPEKEVDNHQENMRQAENDRVAREQTTRMHNETEQRERDKNAAIGLKLVREKKPFTFDYDGVSQGITPMHLPAEAVRKLKQELRSEEVLKKDRMCETMQVANPRQRQQGKILRGEVPVFSEKGFSVVQALGDDSHLSEGVKITEVRGSSNNVSLQHRAKRPQGKPYRLKDYKNLTKEKSFREFPHATSSRKNSLLDLSASGADNQQDQKLKTIRRSRQSKPKSRGQSQQALQSLKSKARDDALGRGLPFIRTKGLKFYDIGSASSLKTVEFSFNSSERRSQWRSKIKISDSSLYEDVLLN